MKKKLVLAFLVIVMFAFLLFLIFTSRTSVWDKTYGGTGRDDACSVVQTTDGGYALLGETQSFGAGSWDLWLVKTDSSGNMEWNKTYGGAESDRPWSLIRTDDGGYAIVGYTESFGAGSCDLWLVKTDTSGKVQWSKTYGGTGEEIACSVVQTSDGGYAIAGYTHSFGAGKSDFWLIKTDSSGNHKWNETYGSPGIELAYCMIQTRYGGYAIVGCAGGDQANTTDYWLVKTDGNGKKEWDKKYSLSAYEDVARSLVQTRDGGYAIVGYTCSSGAGEYANYDFWLVKTDQDGNMQWDQTYGGTSDDSAWAISVIQTSDGGYAIIGHTGPCGSYRQEVLMIKTDSSGNQQRRQTYARASGDRGDFGFSVIQTSDGGYAIAGVTDYLYRGSAGCDFWLIKTDANLASLPAPFWTQWWFWLIYGGVPSVFIVWYMSTRISKARVRRKDVEKMVLDYIKAHKGMIRISECAKEYGIAEKEVKEAILQLQKKGFVKMSS